MNDADIIREAIWDIEGVFPGDPRLAALDRLVNDQQRAWDYEAKMLKRAVAAEAALRVTQTERDTYKSTALFHARKAKAAEALVAQLQAALEPFADSKNWRYFSVDGEEWIVWSGPTEIGPHSIAALAVLPGVPDE